MPGDVPDFLEATQAAYEDGWNSAMAQKPPCACEGREVLAAWHGWMGGNQTGGYPLARIRYLKSDVPVYVLVFAAEEGAKE